MAAKVVATYEFFDPNSDPRYWVVDFIKFDDRTYGIDWKPAGSSDGFAYLFNTGRYKQFSELMSAVKPSWKLVFGGNPRG